MTVYPKISSLEESLFTHLLNQVSLTNLANLSAIHPDSPDQLADGEGRLVIGTISSDRDWQSRSAQEPKVQLTAWGHTYAEVRNLLEVTEELIETLEYTALSGIDQKITVCDRTTLINPTYSEKTDLFFGALIYSFHLTKA